MGDFDLSEIIGKTIGEAKVILKKENLMIRVLKRDGKSFPPSPEHKNNRVNIHLDHNIITEVFGIF